MKNGAKKIYIGLILVLLFSLVILENNNVYSYYNDLEKIYCEADLHDEFSNDKIIVVLNEEESKKDLANTIEKFGSIQYTKINELNNSEFSKARDSFKKIISIELEEKTKENVLTTINTIMSVDGVVCACPDYIISPSSVSINDTYNSLQWGLESIDYPLIFDAINNYDDTLVGVIDSGIDSYNTDLYDRVNVNLSRDFTLGEETVVNYLVDPTGHGTQVAGIIGAITNNYEGITGINSNIKLVSLRVFDENEKGSITALALAIDYANKKNIRILNFSGGLLSVNIEWNYALECIIDSYNGLLICTAGNEGLNNDEECNKMPTILTLPNILVVGAHDQNDKRSIWSNISSSNYGKESVDIFAPGTNILSTFSTSLCYGCDYIFSDGTRACEINISTLNRILTVMNTTNQTWEDIDEQFSEIYAGPDSPNGKPSDFKISNHKAHGYHYMDGTSIAAPFVAGVASLILSKYPYLSPTAIKEIIMNGVEKVYDDQGNSVFEDLCVSGGKLNAYQSLNSYKEITINDETEVVNNLNEGKGLFGFYTDKSQFIKITMNAVLQSGNLTYPEGSFRLLNSKGEVVKKYEMSEFTDNAVNKEGYNTLNVFLPEPDYYYIDVDYNANNLCSLKLKVENIDMYNMQIDLFDYSDYYELDLYLINNVNTVDYLKELTINQAAKYNFKITTNGSYRLVVLKRNELGLFSELTVYKNEEYVGNQDIEIGLPHGTYYIGYFELTNNSTFTLSMHRIVNQNNGVTLLPDPLQSINCGSQINVVEKDINYAYRSYGENTILEGFTRIIYLSNWTSRTDYYWYSSNEDVAMVTDFGTVLAKDVSQNTEIKIMAVNKHNPSVVYIKEFVILNDNENYNSSPIDINISMTVSVSTLTSINFGNVHVPYNFLQYYNWESSNSDYAIVDSFGRVYAYRDGIGELVTITGVYIYNPRVKININLNIVE